MNSKKVPVIIIEEEVVIDECPGSNTGVDASKNLPSTYKTALEDLSKIVTQTLSIGKENWPSDKEVEVTLGAKVVIYPEVKVNIRQK